MKKHLWILTATAFLFACGGENETNESEGLTEEDLTCESADVDESVENEVDGTLENGDFIPENSDGLWQIDDYAEMMMGQKIFASADAMNNNGDGVEHYYQTLDLKGGYAAVTGAYEGWSEFVLWRMADGNDLLGTMSAGCGPACDYDFKFYIMKDGEKVGEGNNLIPRMEVEDYGASLMPKILEKYEGIEYQEDYQFFYNFPQKGTSMEVDIIVGADEVRIPIMMLSWDKKKFSVKEKYTELNERMG
ncbi:hypothetical protein K6119_05135 [Paracrocinitomix mangrovi]|uniref:hypothetical protein n=1 Tax=Paracrocinitomix mangrovi TaxID=2862509 RepID=UPI001C8E677C|nr:hypothetical protein [Paracrocinitomix mangrovi]UKN02897.1 hypothetical protein K6119_05135 [Paracrocinitomix mangrovi]